jgi:hypothetical protein
MKHIKVAMLPCTLIIVMVALFLRTGVTRAAQASGCGGWSVVSTPKIGSNFNYLNGVAALSANDVWAVGAYFNGSGFRKTLIEQWDGTKWSKVLSPNVGSDNNVLFGVAAISANDVWAVGGHRTRLGTYQTLIEHWDGTSWSIVSSPNVGSGDNALLGLLVTTARDIWTVGYSSSSQGPLQTLVGHWDGTSWSVVPSPNIGSGDNVLQAIEQVQGKNQLWAVGLSTDSSGTQQTLIERWDGTSWSSISSPNVGSGDNALRAIAVTSSNNAWVVGYSAISANFEQALIEHWDGTDWSVVSSPNPGAVDNFLNGIVRVPGSSTIWAVGGYANSNNDAQALAEVHC